MKLLTMIVILSLFLLILSIGFAQPTPPEEIPKEKVQEETPEEVVTGPNLQVTGSFIAEAGSKLILQVKLEIDGELINSCNVLGADPCVEITWGFKDPYTFEVSQNECALVPTSYGLFQCVIDVPETTGETEVFFSYKTYGEKAVGKLDVAGGGKRKLTVYKCGDDECNGPETQETCCIDCDSPPLYKCENNKLVSSCGDGLCQTIYTEGQNNCCNDCGSPIFYKCENRGLVLDTLQLGILIFATINCIVWPYVLLRKRSE